MKHATFGKRLVAHIGTGLMNLGVGAAFLALAIDAKINQSASELLIGLVIGGAAYLAFLFFNYVYLVSKKGYSIEKKIAGLRIVDGSNGNLTMGKAAIRLIVKRGCFLFTLPGALVYAFSIWTRDDKQSLGDKAAGSYVVEA